MPYGCMQSLSLCYVKLCCRGKRCGHPGEIGAPSLESWLKSTHGLQMPSVNSFAMRVVVALASLPLAAKDSPRGKECSAEPLSDPRRELGLCGFLKGIRLSAQGFRAARSAFVGSIRPSASSAPTLAMPTCRGQGRSEQSSSPPGSLSSSRVLGKLLLLGNPRHLQSSASATSLAPLSEPRRPAGCAACGDGAAETRTPQRMLLSEGFSQVLALQAKRPQDRCTREKHLRHRSSRLLPL